MLTVLSLCDYSGRWSEPYRKAGYNVIQVDLKLGQDVRLLEYQGNVQGVLAAPPCTAFASSGARWWAAKGEKALLEGLALVDACLRVVTVCRPFWWALENPVGRLKRYLGPPRLSFHPSDFAGHLEDHTEEAYTKRTHLWGSFNYPEERPVDPVLGSMMWKKYGGKSERTKTARSMTPRGFAQAFCKANP